MLTVQLHQHRQRQRYVFIYTRFVQKVSGLTTVHEVDKAYGVLTLIVFYTVPFRSYTLRPTFLPLPLLIPT